MSESDANFIVNNDNNNDSSICASKMCLEDDAKSNSGGRDSCMIGASSSCVENFAEAWLKESPLTFGKRIKHKTAKKFLFQEAQFRDRPKKNPHTKSTPVLLDSVTTEVPLDVSEVTRAEDYLENIKTVLRKKVQIEVEAVPPV